MDVSPDLDDFAGVQVKGANFEIVIVAYYCPPQCDLQLDTTTLESFVNAHVNCVIIGDLNAKHLF